MKSKRLLTKTFTLALFGVGLVSLTACVPMEQVRRPSLREVRLGNAQGPVAEDMRLATGEISGELAEINPSRQEFQVLMGDGRRQVLRYDVNRTRVIYHGLDYSVDNLEAGDRIAFDSRLGNASYVDTVRVQEPVQSRSGSRIGSPAPARPRTEVVEGTVESVDVNRGLFDVRPPTGANVTVSVPYNARATDVESFRSLRRGDAVRVEGEFVNRDSFQLLSFLSPRGR